MAETQEDECSQLFSGVSVVLDPEGIHPVQFETLLKKFIGEGGHRASAVGDGTTHVVATSLSVLTRKHDWKKATWLSVQSNLKVVSFEWISACLEAGKKSEEQDFNLFMLNHIEHSSPPRLIRKKRKPPSILVPTPKCIAKLLARYETKSDD